MRFPYASGEHNGGINSGFIYTKGQRKMSKTSKKIFAVVTTEYKGVFFGEVNAADVSKSTVRVEKAQMAVYWSSDCKGIMGLAAVGPTQGCKIGPVVPAITLQKVTAVMEASADAEKAWRAAPWR